MKSLFYTSLILAIALVLYQFLAPLFPSWDIAPVVSPTANRRVEESAASPKVAGVAPLPNAPKTVPAEPVEPKVETLEELTKNWTVIPASAFPRKVKLLREATFKSVAGSSRLAAGTEVVALACDKGVMNLAPDQSSPVRGLVRVGDTDLKTQFNDSYAKWAASRLELLRQQQAQSHSNEPPKAASVPGGVDESGKPVRGSDGTYPVLVASMKSGQVTDITPKKVKMWGTPQLATMEGRPTWVIDVNYDTIVFCGPIEARAQAHVRDGRVIRWVYPGSGELVP